MSTIASHYPQTRPPNVETSVKLLFASFYINLLINLIDSLLAGELFSFSGLLALFLTFWLYWALITLISRGHRKAFIAYYCIAAVGFLISFYPPVQDIVALPSHWLFEVLSLAITIMNLIALFLLLQKPSIAWFNSASVSSS